MTAAEHRACTREALRFARANAWGSAVRAEYLDGGERSARVAAAWAAEAEAARLALRSLRTRAARRALRAAEAEARAAWADVAALRGCGE